MSSVSHAFSKCCQQPRRVIEDMIEHLIALLDAADESSRDKETDADGEPSDDAEEGTWPELRLPVSLVRRNARFGAIAPGVRHGLQPQPCRAKRPFIPICRSVAVVK